MERNPQKTRGKVYTPEKLVTQILDLAGYYGEAILDKRIMENSCGDGAFLAQIVDRYCRVADARAMTPRELRERLERHIYGIELDKDELRKCRERLDEIAASFNVRNAQWRLECNDATAARQYVGKMDFVVGNPPYVRVHNLGESASAIRRFTFAQSGMIDLYIVFYELGIEMLAPCGTLAYITPSSFFTSAAGARMRASLVERQILRKLVDLKHAQPFETATTYTTIAVLQKDGARANAIEYFEYDERQGPCFVDSLTTEEFYLGGKFYFGARDALKRLRKIIENHNVSDLDVKNGFATLCDSVYVDPDERDSRFVIPVVKASKGVWRKIIYPYGDDARPLPEDVLRQDANVYARLCANRAKLDARAAEPSAKKFWYAYGRSQGVADVAREKLAINTLIRDERDLKLVVAPPGSGVYSGLYVTSDSIPLARIADALRAKEFAEYVALLGKYKSGGFYAFSSKDVKTYLNYKLSERRVMRALSH